MAYVTSQSRDRRVMASWIVTLSFQVVYTTVVVLVAISTMFLPEPRIYYFVMTLQVYYCYYY